jgi:hypothetical protein
MVNARFEVWRKTLGAILDSSVKQPRFFAREVKQALFKANSTCALCKQAIPDLDDAAVDHIKQYWLGGKTIPENARLTHRYCNWSRARKEPAAPKQQTSASALIQPLPPKGTNAPTKPRGEEDGPERHHLRLSFWQGLLSRPQVKITRHANLTPGKYHYIAAGTGVRGLPLVYVIRQNKGGVELYIDRGTGQAESNKRIFDWLAKRKGEIERVFGGKLSWERIDDKRSSRIAYTVAGGGWKSNEGNWPEIQDAMIDAMIRLENALTPHLAKLETELASEGP